MKPPNKMYVQWYGEEKPAKDDDREPAEITWSKDRIYKHDIVYVRIKKRRRSC